MIRKLYNYMPTQYLESWLTKGVYFGCARFFDDAREGHLTRRAVNNLTSDIAEKVRSHGKEPDNELLEEVGAVSHCLARGAKHQTFISCWHENTVYSPRMAAAYARGGVYIATTNDRLIRSIRRNLCQLLYTAAGEQDPPFLSVNYIPSLLDPMDLQARNDLLCLMFHRNKWTHWEWQREHRLIVDAAELAVLTGKAINGAQVPNGADNLRIDPTGLETGPEDDNGVVGYLYLKADPWTLIDEIGVIEPERFNYVASLCERYGIRKPRQVTDFEKSLQEEVEDVPNNSPKDQPTSYLIRVEFQPA